MAEGCNSCGHKKYKTYEEGLYPYEVVFVCKKCGNQQTVWDTNWSESLGRIVKK